MTPIVYVLWANEFDDVPIAQPLKVCRDLAEAEVLAAVVSDVFRCPTWIAAFERPADKIGAQLRHFSEITKKHAPI